MLNEKDQSKQDGDEDSYDGENGEKRRDVRHKRSENSALPDTHLFANLLPPVFLSNFASNNCDYCLLSEGRNDRRKMKRKKKERKRRMKTKWRLMEMKIWMEMETRWRWRWRAERDEDLAVVIAKSGWA